MTILVGLFFTVGWPMLYIGGLGQKTFKKICSFFGDAHVIQTLNPKPQGLKLGGSQNLGSILRPPYRKDTLVTINPKSWVL